jgi:hypothetical protein
LHLLGTPLGRFGRYQTSVKLLRARTRIIATNQAKARLRLLLAVA